MQNSNLLIKYLYYIWTVQSSIRKSPNCGTWDRTSLLANMTTPPQMSNEAVWSRILSMALPLGLLLYPFHSVVLSAWSSCFSLYMAVNNLSLTHFKDLENKAQDPSCSSHWEAWQLGSRRTSWQSPHCGLCCCVFTLEVWRSRRILWVHGSSQNSGMRGFTWNKHYDSLSQYVVALKTLHLNCYCCLINHSKTQKLSKNPF